MRTLVSCKLSKPSRVSAINGRKMDAVLVRIVLTNTLDLLQNNDVICNPSIRLFTERLEATTVTAEVLAETANDQPQIVQKDLLDREAVFLAVEVDNPHAVRADKGAEVLSDDDQIVHLVLDDQLAQ